MRDKVYKLGKEIGFGRLMDLASKCWRESLAQIGFEGGEFVTGPCRSGTVPCICKDRAKCQYCRGCGWLTKAVKEIIEKEIN